MLTLDSVSVRAGDATLLQEVSLTLGANEIAALLGPSGSGKTTLLRVVAGLTDPYAGTVSSVDGGVGFLFQDFTLFPHMNVQRNILVGIRKLEKAVQRERLERLASLLGIESLLKRAVHDLSGGEQQRVALARTLVLQPRLLLLDEPFSNLDKMTKVGLYHDVKRIIRDEGMSAILATHDQEEAFFFSDRLVMMSGGRLVAAADPRAMYEQPNTEWIARFTGEAHIWTEKEMAALFGLNDLEPGRWLVRPEDIEVGEGDVAEIVDIEFYGFYSRMLLKTSEGLSLSASCLGSTGRKPGDRVGLTLKKKAIRLES